jgi:hypothetical protein
MDARTLDATNLAERLRWEQQEFRLHLEAASALEKYPGKCTRPEVPCQEKCLMLMMDSETACAARAGEAGSV